MIYIFGSGGRAKLIREIIQSKFVKSKIIFIDDFNKKFKNSKYLIKFFKPKSDKLFIGISDPIIQKKYYDFFKKKLKKIDNSPLIDKSVKLKSNVKIDKNVIILENTVIGPDVIISKNSFIGSNVLINHDSSIGHFSTIGHGSNIAGNVKIKNFCYVGISNVIKQNITINNYVTTGSGSNIIKNCREKKIYAGNPAQKLNKKI